jgi:hypothetical protein
MGDSTAAARMRLYRARIKRGDEMADICTAPTRMLE